ncbi:MAG: hypothetical protein ACRD96_12925, partial [Bryobacteraceae bacterium]
MRDATSRLAAVVALAVVPSAARADADIGAGVFLGGGLFGDTELGNSAYDDQIPGAAPLFGLRAGLRFAARFGA